MMMHNNEPELLTGTMVVVLDGGRANRIVDLTCDDCKLALPFGGVLKNIDLTLSNCLNSHLAQVGVVLESQSASLLSHLQSVWAPLRESRHFTVTTWLPESTDSNASYFDTVDALLKNWPRISLLQPQRVMILIGDQIGKIDLRRLLNFHVKKGADVTLGCVEVPLAVASRSCVIKVEEGYRVSGFTEKPNTPSTTPYRKDRAFASMGIYVFNTDVLRNCIGFDIGQKESTDDISRDIIPNMLSSSNVVAYPFSNNDPIGGGYWRGIDNLHDYWLANMEILGSSPEYSINDSVWPLHGCFPHSANNWIGTHYLTDGTKISNSLIAADCVISSATISHTVISPNTHIGNCSSIHESIIHPDVSIGRSCCLHGVIVRSGCHIPDGMHLLNPQSQNNQFKSDWSPIVVTQKHCDDLSFEVNGVVQ